MEGKYLAKRLFLLVWVGCKHVHIWEWIKNPKGPVISNFRDWEVSVRGNGRDRWRQCWAKLMRWDLVPWHCEPVKTSGAAPAWKIQEDILCQNSVLPVWCVAREILLYITKLQLKKEKERKGKPNLVISFSRLPSSRRSKHLAVLINVDTIVSAILQIFFLSNRMLDNLAKVHRLLYWSCRRSKRVKLTCI